MIIHISYEKREMRLMYTLVIGNMEGEFSDLDEAMNNCFEIFERADFSGWNESESVCWMDIFLDNSSQIIVWKIIES